jgi:hypothetical protein
MKHCDICGEPGEYQPRCPGCGAVTSHPKSLDHDKQEAWWCDACLYRKVKEAR